MSEHDLVGLNDKIGFFERILRERDRTDREYRLRIDERFGSLSQALTLQAAEYERRLHDLNGEYKRDKERQQEFVSVDKYEDKLTAEAEARTVALTRIDERFSEFITRYEARQREVDLLLQAQSQSTVTAERAAEKAANNARDAAAEQGRKSNRNIAIATIILAVLVAVANYIGQI